MRAYVIQGSFGLDNLTLVERPSPALRSTGLRLRMLAASLNYRDLLMVEGRYNPHQALPLVPLSDGVGEVVAVGDDVEGISPGELVAPIFAQGWQCGDPSKDELRSTLGGPRDGTLTEEMTVPANAVVKIPPGLNPVDAATLPCAALTAWNALVTLGAIRAGDTILVQGTGGVSIFALQFGKMFGAEVIVTSSRDDKLARARALGADHTINYVTTKDWGKAARAIAGGRGVDHVIDVGGAATLGQSLRAVRPGGTISVIGILSGTKSDVDLTPILMNQIRVQGVFVGHRRAFEDMNRAITLNGVVPVVDRTFPFAEATEAFRYLRSQAHVGKVCIRLDG